MKDKAKPHIVIFVEGDTDEIFFNSLISFYKANSVTEVASCEVVNLRGVARYSGKVTGKLKNEICPKAEKRSMYVKAVCCSYDTDVFEYAERPVVDWKKVKKVIHDMGIRIFHQIEVRSMIEDWLLNDLSGICNFLKIEKPNSTPGKTGFEKMQNLYKKANRVYLKGRDVSKLMPYLCFQTIRDKRKEYLSILEDLLNVNIAVR